MGLDAPRPLGTPAPSAAEYDRRRLLSRVAEQYYVDNLSQQQIGEELGLSRSQVSRMLSEARDIGVVEIRIHHDLPNDPDLEELVASLAAPRRLTVDVLNAPLGASRRAIGRRAARVVEQLMWPGSSLALTHGTTVHEVMRTLRFDRLPGLRIHQSAGFELGHALTTTWELIRLGFDRLGDDYHYIHAPLKIASDDLHRALTTDPTIVEVLEAAGDADMAVLGVASLDLQTSSLVRAGYLTPEELEEARDLGSVGAINGYHYDIDGREVASLNQRILGLSPAEFGAVPVRLLVAAGRHKAPAVLGTIRAGWVTHLVIDRDCAEGLVEAAGQGSGI
jgi:DNA-binding transcriptional regulator LsrR (DeoR family)